MGARPFKKHLYCDKKFWSINKREGKADMPMANQVNISSQYFNWSGEPIFGLLIVSNNDIGQFFFCHLVHVKDKKNLHLLWQSPFRKYTILW